MDTIVYVDACVRGKESNDWARMLSIMYVRYAERHGWKTYTRASRVGEVERFIVNIDGEYAYKQLMTNSGIHSLTRISPFDTQHRRHTSFAVVMVKYGGMAVDINNQVRTYIFDPYKMVKDLRTGIETENIESVLDGDLDIFLNR